MVLSEDVKTVDAVVVLDCIVVIDGVVVVDGVIVVDDVIVVLVDSDVLVDGVVVADGIIVVDGVIVEAIIPAALECLRHTDGVFVNVTLMYIIFSNVSLPNGPPQVSFSSCNSPIATLVED